MRNRDNLIVQLDEKSNKQRQRKLYGHNLEFDPNRPIYQHPINLNNFLQSGDQYVFKQLITHIRVLYPNRQLNQDIRLYEEVQQKINNYGEYGYNQQEAILKEINKIKQQIKKVDLQIQKLIVQITQQRQQLAIQLRENKLLREFLESDLNKKILQKLQPGFFGKIPLQQQLQKTKKDFQQLLKNLNQKIRSQISQFQTQYNAIAYENNTLIKQKRNLTQIEAQHHELQTDYSILFRNIRQLQDEIDKINQQIGKQNDILALSSSVRSDHGSENEQSSSKRSSSLGNSQSSSLSSYQGGYPIEINRRQYVHFKKQDNTRYFLYWLIIATIVLGVVTMFRIRRC